MNPKNNIYTKIYSKDFRPSYTRHLRLRETYNGNKKTRGMANNRWKYTVARKSSEGDGGGGGGGGARIRRGECGGGGGGARAVVALSGATPPLPLHHLH